MVNRLEEKSWQDVEAYLERDDRIIMPVGSTEQHGTFAPLGTDSYVAQTLAADAGERTGVMVSPPVWFGWSPHHLVRPGTISIRAEVLIEFLFDAVQSLAGHGFRKFVLLNGHRIVNIPWLQIAAERMQRELSVRAYLFDPAYMSKEICQDLGFGPIGHAEEIEISHMLYRFPELIAFDRAADHPHEERLLYHLDPHDPRDTLCYVPATREDLQEVFDRTGDAIGGRPTASSAENGKRYHDHLVSRLVEVLELIKD
jgi:creatinine amidohydrolase